MSAVNPLEHLSDTQLVFEHSRHPVDNHYLSEMIRRQMKASADLGDKLWWLTVWLLVFTVAIFALTGVLVWSVFRGVSQ